MSAFNRILVPLDGSERAEAALRWVHLVPSQQVRLVQVCDDEQPDADASARYLEDVAARLCPPDRAVETRVVHGVPAEGIVASAADADLIVMSSQGAGGGGRRLYGSVADRVARHAPVPTLLVRGGHDPVVAEPLRRIVVPLDGSPAAERALPLAALLGAILDAPAHLLSVSETAGDEGDAGRPREDDARARAYLAQQAASLGDRDVATSTECAAGDPAGELLARIEPGDLLVITTHGHGSARRWQIGTVAEKLLRQAPAPVVLVRADAP
jgi:nucleotide-binding universal stress UspA family protein